MEADTLGCIIFLLGAGVPRVLVLAAWHNDQAAWQAAFGFHRSAGPRLPAPALDERSPSC